MFRSAARVLGTVATAAALVGGGVVGASAVSGAGSKPDVARFHLFPNPVNIPCLQGSGEEPPTVEARVTRGDLNDTLTLRLNHFKPDLDFDLFTVQNSNQQADGSPVAAFTNFGLAWYQSDVHTNEDGRGTVEIKTILLDQIFGFDPAVGLAPTNTFHVGFWFNNPDDAAGCGFTGFTPFNGEHHAGPLAFITRPDADTGLGPLCTDPTTDDGGNTVCNP